MPAIEPEVLSPVLAMSVGAVVFALFFRLVMWDTALGREMRKSVVIFVLVVGWVLYGGTKPGDGQRLLDAGRELLRWVSPGETVLPKSETLSSPEYSDKEASASVGFGRDFGCSIMEVSVSARCVNTSYNSLEIVFVSGVEDDARADLMVGFEDGTWICAAGDAFAFDEVGISPPAGQFELTMALTLASDGRVADCEVRAGGARVPFLEGVVRAATPRDWRRLTVYSRNGDGAQPSIEVGAERVGMTIRIR